MLRAFFIAAEKEKSFLSECVSFSIVLERQRRLLSATATNKQQLGWVLCFYAKSINQSIKFIFG